MYVWENGGLDVGYWCSFAEMWFKKRLSRIRSHEDRPKSVRDWKKDLGNFGRAKRLSQAIEKASAQFLDAHCQI